jgi:hydrogenase maturation protease
MIDKSLFVGIGSPHGDDAAGWCVARELAVRASAKIDVRSAHTPAELLNWLEGVETLEVCDAVVCSAKPGSLHQWRWPDPALASTRFRGSHDLSLTAALALAEQLGQLPPEVRVWGIAAGEWRELAPLSPAIAAAVPAIVAEIWESLHHA